MTRPIQATHHAALLAVQHGRVTYFDGCAAHVQGYGWEAGGHMPESFQALCGDLKSTGYIHHGHVEFCGNRVVTTAAGDTALAVWARKSVGDAA